MVHVYASIFYGRYCHSVLWQWGLSIQKLYCSIRMSRNEQLNCSALVMFSFQIARALFSTKPATPCRMNMLWISIVVFTGASVLSVYKGSWVGSVFMYLFHSKSHCLLQHLSLHLSYLISSSARHPLSHEPTSHTWTRTLKSCSN